MGIRQLGALCKPDLKREHMIDADSHCISINPRNPERERETETETETER